MRPPGCWSVRSNEACEAGARRDAGLGDAAQALFWLPACMKGGGSWRRRLMAWICLSGQTMCRNGDLRSSARHVLESLECRVKIRSKIDLIRIALTRCIAPSLGPTSLEGSSAPILLWGGACDNAALMKFQADFLRRAVLNETRDLRLSAMDSVSMGGIGANYRSQLMAVSGRYSAAASIVSPVRTAAGRRRAATPTCRLEAGCRFRPDDGC